MVQRCIEIDIVHRLRDVRLIGYKEGWQDAGGRGFVTRIWPTEKLIKMFENAAFGDFDIGYSDDRETIILRDENKNDVEYEDDVSIESHDNDDISTEYQNESIQMDVVGDTEYSSDTN